MAKEDLLAVEGKINEILPDGCFGVTLDNEHRIIAYTAGKMRRHRIRSVVGGHVHVEMTPYDLTKARIIYRELTPGQGPSSIAGRISAIQCELGGAAACAGSMTHLSASERA